MSEDEAVAALDALTSDDNERSHGVADDILLWFVPEAITAAYERAAERVGFWYA